MIIETNIRQISVSDKIKKTIKKVWLTLWTTLWVSFSLFNTTFASFELSSQQVKDILTQQKDIQQTYWVSIDIDYSDSKEVAKQKSTADILLRLDLKHHKMQDFVRNLELIFNHTDLDSCRNSIKINLKDRDLYGALDKYQDCVSDKLWDKINQIKEKAKNLWIIINTNNLFEVKKYLSEIEKAEKLEQQEITKRTTKIIRYFILFALVSAFITYLTILYFYKKQIKKDLSLLDKNLIYLNNIDYMDIKELSDTANELKEKLFNLKKSFWFDKDELSYLEERIKKLVNKILKTIEKSKEIKEETGELHNKFNNILND